MVGVRSGEGRCDVFDLPSSSLSVAPRPRSTRGALLAIALEGSKFGSVQSIVVQRWSCCRCASARTSVALMVVERRGRVGGQRTLGTVDFACSSQVPWAPADYRLGVTLKDAPLFVLSRAEGIVSLFCNLFFSNCQCRVTKLSRLQSLTWRCFSSRHRYLCPTRPRPRVVSPAMATSTLGALGPEEVPCIHPYDGNGNHQWT